MSNQEVIAALKVLAQAYLASPHACFDKDDEGTAPIVIADAQLLAKFVGQLDAGLREWMFESFQDFENSYTCRVCGRFDANGKEVYVRGESYVYQCRACMPEACRGCTQNGCQECSHQPAIVLDPNEEEDDADASRDEPEPPEPDFPACCDCAQNRDGEPCAKCNAWVCLKCQHAIKDGVMCDPCYRTWCDQERERHARELDYRETPLGEQLDDNPVPGIDY